MYLPPKIISVDPQDGIEESKMPATMVKILSFPLAPGIILLLFSCISISTRRAQITLRINVLLAFCASVSYHTSEHSLTLELNTVVVNITNT